MKRERSMIGTRAHPAGCVREGNPWCLFLVGAVAAIAAVLAIGAGPVWGHGPVRYSTAIAPLYQFQADLDQGGRYAVSGVLLHSSVARSMSESVNVGFSLGYDYEHYAFKSPAFTGGVRPWSDIHTIQGALSYTRSTDDRWLIHVSPSLRFSGESGAKTSDALAWGAMLSISRVISPDLLLGAGISYTDNIDKHTVIPVVLVQWNITDRLALGNAPRTGPAGPSGLELSCRIGENGEMAVGGGWRSKRFRLERHGFVPGGVAQRSSLPLWVRLSRLLSAGARLDLYGGALLSGDLGIDDVHGNRVAGEDQATAAFVAGSLSVRF